MNLFQKVIIVVFMLGFPLVSYYYIKMGFNMRKNALDHLKNEIAFDANQSVLLKNIDSVAYNKWSDEVLIVHRVKDGNMDEMYKFADYLDGRKDFNILALFNNPASKCLQDTIYSQMITRTFLPQGSIDTILGTGVDNQLCYKLKKRSSYKSDQEGIGTLYKHTIILLPLKKKDKLDLKREEEL